MGQTAKPADAARFTPTSRTAAPPDLVIDRDKAARLAFSLRSSDDTLYDRSGKADHPVFLAGKLLHLILEVMPGQASDIERSTSCT